MLFTQALRGRIAHWRSKPSQRSPQTATPTLPEWGTDAIAPQPVPGDRSGLLGRSGWRWSSLQGRLTLELGAIAVLSLSTAALWSTWQMEQTLATAHKQTLSYISQRFPEELALYDQHEGLASGLTTTIDKVAMAGLLAWVTDDQGRLLAQPKDDQNYQIVRNLVQSLPAAAQRLTIVHRDGRVWVLCEQPLTVRGRAIGRVYFAQDVSHDWHKLHGSLRLLWLVNGLAMVVALGAIGRRIRLALLPLATMSQVASAVSADDLAGARLELQGAPDEVRGLAQAFNEMLARLSRSWEQQRQFVGNVSHELRTPLTVVLGYLQSLLRRSTNLNDYQLQALTTAEAEADRTVRMLQDLLDLARIDNRQLHLRQAPIVLNTLLSEVTDWQRLACDRPIHLHLVAEDVVVLADRDRLTRAIRNLLDNAVKYSASEQPVTLQLSHQADWATIEVRDRGMGIPPDQQGRVFERFYRGEDEMTRSRDGTGLGLAIAKGAVEGMGGRIDLQSQPGLGSTFTIRLPRWHMPSASDSSVDQLINS